MEDAISRTELTRTPLTLGEIKTMGGGAQIEFLPFTEGDLGLRVYKDTKFPEAHSAEAVIKGIAESYQLRWALAEALLSLNLPESYQPATPKLLAFGILISEGEGSFYYEIKPEEMKGKQIYDVLSCVYFEGLKIAETGVKPKIFSLVEKVPIAEWGETDPSLYYSPRDLANSDTSAYQKGLIAGLMFYREAINFGLWNFDIENKNPFLCDKNGNVKVIDTAGFYAIRGSRAENLMKGFYQHELTTLEEQVTQELKESAPSPLSHEEQAEYDKLQAQIKELKTEGQNLLAALGIEEEISRYGFVKDKLQVVERNLQRDLQWKERRKQSFEHQLQELKAKKAEADEQRTAKSQAEEFDKKIQVVEKRLREAEKEQNRTNALRELRDLAAQVVSSGVEEIDNETWNRLFKLEWKTGIKNRQGNRTDLYCRDALKEIEALDREKPISKRLEDAKPPIEEATQELTKLKDQRASLGKIPAYIFEPSDYEIKRVEEDLARSKSEEGIGQFRQSITRIKEIIEVIKTHSSLDFEIRSHEKKIADTARQKIEHLRSILFEEELLKSIGKQPRVTDIIGLLRETGFETFLQSVDAEDAENLRKFYEQVKDSQYPIKEPKTILDIFIAQIEKVPAGKPSNPALV